MSEVNPPFVIGAAENTAEEFRRVIETLAQGASGVIASGDMAVTASITPDMNVRIAGGKALVPGTSGPHPGLYHIINDGFVTKAITPADIASTRIDVIIALIDDTEYGGTTDTWYVDVVEGTPGGGVPTLPDSCLPLAEISLPALAPTVTNAYITDVRSVAQFGADPTGTIKMTAKSVAPAGYLICDGTAVSRTTYSALFSAIGTAFGIGDGSTTFNVPDMRGRSPLGVGTGTATGATAHSLGSKSGEETHILTSGENGAHTHGVNDTNPGSGSPHGWGSFAPLGTLGGGFHVGLYGGTVPGHNADYYGLVNLGPTGVSIQASGFSTPHNNMHPYTTVTFCIKT